ncbi:MAG: phosphate ABC transporter substrate-binding protein PstS [Bacteriovoracaceae bacterium]
MKLLITLLFLMAHSSFAAVKINGAGASFPYPVYSKWISNYKTENPDIQINYQSIGSGGGIRQLLKQTVDFGASDAPMKDKELKKAAWPILHIPTVLGAVSVAHNVEGLGSNLKLDGATLANIFLGNITKWNDPAIASLNKGIKLPNTDILIVHRADGSGTTSVFSEYLSKLSSQWKDEVGKGKSLQWPTGIGAKGNEGVTAMIKQTSGAIGYISLEYALSNNISTIMLKNKAGHYVSPTVASVSAAAAHITDFSGDMRISITDAPGKEAYPISAFTFILLPKTKEKSNLTHVRKFLNWALTKGQNGVKELNYAPLPKGLAKAMLTKLEE